MSSKLQDRQGKPQPKDVEAMQEHQPESEQTQKPRSGSKIVQLRLGDAMNPSNVFEWLEDLGNEVGRVHGCLLYTSPSPRDS